MMKNICLISKPVTGSILFKSCSEKFHKNYRKVPFSVYLFHNVFNNVDLGGL